MKSFVLCVFGEQWEVFVATPDDKRLLKRWVGYADRSNRQIYIKDLRSDPDERDMERLDLIMAETLRHELTHAGLFECGMMDNGRFDHEQIADWLQMKIHSLYATILEGEKKLSAICAEGDN